MLLNEGTRVHLCSGSAARLILPYCWENCCANWIWIVDVRFKGKLIWTEILLGVVCCTFDNCNWLDFNRWIEWSDISEARYNSRFIIPNCQVETLFVFVQEDWWELDCSILKFSRRSWNTLEILCDIYLYTRGDLLPNFPLPSSINFSSSPRSKAEVFLNGKRSPIGAGEFDFRRGNQDFCTCHGNWSWEFQLISRFHIN